MLHRWVLLVQLPDEVCNPGCGRPGGWLFCLDILPGKIVGDEFCFFQSVVEMILCIRKTEAPSEFDSAVALLLNCLHALLWGLAGQCPLCLASQIQPAHHRQPGSRDLMSGIKARCKYFMALNYKTSEKGAYLYDALGNPRYIIRSADSISGSLFGWEGQKSGWWNVKGRELKFSSSCDQMFTGFQLR